MVSCCPSFSCREGFSMVTCEGLVTALPDSFRSYLKNKVLASTVQDCSQPERLAQVHLTDLGVGKDFFRTTGCNDRALIDDVGPRADSAGLAHIMVSNQDADAAMRQLADNALDIQHRQRIHARKRLIQEHDPRLGRQGAGDLDAPPLSARERHAESSAHLADAQVLEQLLEALLACGALQVRPGLENRLHIVFHRQLAEHRGLLRQVSEPELCPAVHRQQRDVGVLQSNTAGVARHEPDDHVEGRGLAGTIGPEQSDDLTAGELERQVAHDLAGLVALGESRSLQAAHGCAVGCGLTGSALPGSGGGGFAGSALPGPGTSRGAMMMCTRWSVPGDAAACTRCARTLYTSRGPEISFCPSVSHASFDSCTVPSLRS